ncbi:MAG TPA: orotidine-5'-phosphate decarboxylase [Syntrophothermus lipocalidus]|nr:orotidine-5'-phosphate decarboxylase [Syntrophothermus lipocalidus]
MKPPERLIVALDVDTEEEALSLVDELRDVVGVFKIGMQLFDSAGPDIVRKITRAGGRVFVDLKFHDIPNTVSAAARIITRLGAYMFNVHVAGGREMMRQTAKATLEEAGCLGISPPRVLGVTVLTSISEQQLREDLKIQLGMEELVVEWALMARECGLSGVVASPHEIAAIREACGPGFLIVTPGIRPVWADKDDQQRITTPAQAIQLGADYIVIGRPILRGKNRREAAMRIIEELEASI